MRHKLSYEDLTRIALSSQVDLLGIDLVRDINEEDIEKVVGDVIRLEDDLNLVRLICGNCSLFGHENERYLLPMIFHTVHLAFQVEVHRERRDVLYGEGLLRVFTEEYVSEGDDAVFGSDLYLRPHTDTFQ